MEYSDRVQDKEQQMQAADLIRMRFEKEMELLGIFFRLCDARPGNARMMMGEFIAAVRPLLDDKFGPGQVHSFPELQADPQFMAWFAGWRSK
jgi:hypothetical protein